MSIEIRGEHDPKTIEQLQNCMIGSAVQGVLCADGHIGYSMPIGGAIGYTNHVSPSGVGYDIGCGNKAVKTDIRIEELESDGDLPAVMDEIVRRISFGMGRPNGEPVDHPVLDDIREADFAPQRQLVDLAANQLGTVGAGNHYVDLFEGDDGFVWVGVHFGSRGFGHRTASGFLALSQGLEFNEHGSEGEMFSPPVLFEADSGLGQSYISAMRLAGRYAWAGRDLVVDKVCEILGTEYTDTIHNHHNFAWQENHGEELWVVRKGCTPAFPGQKGFVGATMGEPSVILEGVEGATSDLLLNSTVHGAGRAMSRTLAKGKTRRRWTCNNRDCHWFQGPGEHKPEECPLCGTARFHKEDVLLKAGIVDWAQEREDMKDRGIELRGGDADEAVPAYKRLDLVLAHHEDTVRVLTKLYPIGVAMAGPDVVDPFKD